MVAEAAMYTYQYGIWDSKNRDPDWIVSIEQYRTRKNRATYVRQTVHRTFTTVVAKTTTTTSST